MFSTLKPKISKNNNNLYENYLYPFINKPENV